jgi:hypothetical protein
VPIAVGPIGMTVSDVDRPVVFFRDGLTFEKVTDCEFHDDAFDRLTGVFGARLRVLDLRLAAPLWCATPTDTRCNSRSRERI